MKEKDFDKRIKEIVDGYIEPAGEEMWNRISQSYATNQNRKVIKFRRVLYSLSSIAAVVVLFVILDFLGNNETTRYEVFKKENTKTDVAKEQVTIIDKNTKKLGFNKKELQISYSAQKEDTTINVVVKNGNREESETKIAEQEINPSTSNYKYRDYTKRKIEINKKFKSKVLFALATNIAPGSPEKSSDLYYSVRTNSTLNTGNMIIIEQNTIKDAIYSNRINNRYQMPITIGAQIQFLLSENFSLGTGVTYSYLKTDYTTTSSSYTYEVKQELSYIGIPLNLYINIIGEKKIRLYTSLGGMIEKGLRASYKVVSRGANYNYSESIKPLQWSVNAGLGLEYLFTPKLGIYADPSIVYYFKNDQPQSIRTDRPLQFKFELGFRFHL